MGPPMASRSTSPTSASSASAPSAASTDYPCQSECVDVRKVIESDPACTVADPGKPACYKKTCDVSDTNPPGAPGADSR